MKASETTFELAIQDYLNGVFNSLNAAAKAYAVPRTTLSSRLSGSRGQAIAHQHRQRLSPDQEIFLAECILNEDARGSPPSHSRTREMACEILRANGDDEPLGKDWISLFTRRNSEVHSIIGRKLEAYRSAASKHGDIKAFFDSFNRICKDFNILQPDIWNMDETGIALGVCNNS